MSCGQDSCVCVASPGRCLCLCGACAKRNQGEPKARIRNRPEEYVTRADLGSGLPLNEILRRKCRTAKGESQ